MYKGSGGFQLDLVSLIYMARNRALRCRSTALVPSRVELAAALSCTSLKPFGKVGFEPGTPFRVSEVLFSKASAAADCGGGVGDGERSG